MSAMMGTGAPAPAAGPALSPAPGRAPSAGASRTTRANAGASSAVGRLTRTISQPASTRARTCASVASASPVRVHVMDCTATGAPPPTGTAPTLMPRLLPTAASRRELPRGDLGSVAAGEPRPGVGQAGGERRLRLPAQHPLGAPRV